MGDSDSEDNDIQENLTRSQLQELNKAFDSFIKDDIQDEEDEQQQQKLEQIQDKKQILQEDDLSGGFIPDTSQQGSEIEGGFLPVESTSTTAVGGGGGGGGFIDNTGGGAKSILHNYNKDSYSYTTNPNPIRKRSNKDTIHKDSIPSLLKMLQLPCDTQVLDILQDVTDKNDMIKRSEFIKVGGVLIMARDGDEEENQEKEDNDDEESEKEEEEEEEERPRLRRQRKSKSKTKTKQANNFEGESSSMDEYIPNQEEEEEDDDDDENSDNNDLYTDPSRKRPRHRYSSSGSNTAQIKNESNARKIFELFGPVVPPGQVEEVITLEQLKQVFSTLHEKGTEDEMVELLKYATNSDRTMVTFHDFKRVLGQLNLK